MATNGVLFQGFHWFLPADAAHWRELAGRAQELAAAGITAIWLPPMGKGHAGIRSVGYDTYDLFDLGEFSQMGTVPTKYGTRFELEAAISTLRDAGIQIYADVVFNHKSGGDEKEWILAQPVDKWNRSQPLGDWEWFEAWTRFTFPGRGDKYSSFKWHAWCFDSLDYNATTGRSDHVYRLWDKAFEMDVSHEHGNYDFLLANDLDTANPLVAGELRYWGEWLLDTLPIDGFRLDAVKHISTRFFPQWLSHLRSRSGTELFAVGEYWSDDLGHLLSYLDQTQGSMSLFDRPLQARFRDASNDLIGDFDLRRLFESTLVSARPSHAVTFVENHDTQPLCSLESTVRAWFKPHAYAAILLREGGYPCVFQADYDGAPEAPIRREEDRLHSHRFLIDRFLHARRTANFGIQEDYFDYPTTVGWVRVGDGHPAMAVVLSNGFQDGWKDMRVYRPKVTFDDVTGHIPTPVVTDADGNARFPVRARSVSVWLQRADVS